MEWVPAVCTLPTGERPSRIAEFDELFASALLGLERVGATHLRLTLDGGARVRETVRDLMARETGCCSFFTFTLVPDDAGSTVDVEVPAAYAGVLDGLVARAIASAPRDVS
ncbi:hypothetical protein ACIBCT_01920 [Streptosporangium sp. NPDC050855]|uniref:hypothetical protein n=1 Tax=Streptosporangium sp. NPDC050855 TaxID=3366194 RepID=UPI00378B463E